MVDLPAPEEPARATCSPGEIVRLAPCRTGVPCVYAKDTSSRRISPGLAGFAGALTPTTSMTAGT